ncbi:SDR family NAD(P)-dependent oxidoreductase [Phaeobacter sp. J2-8]|uniref:SDR family NAD(P)-dependent oxidoreductase n=1 Tax=Phaeobacter sp. J2-8 TaxID=2931394 RepID=UPI001FD5717B|nr:SDR family NAD(P)-dependent oxidoreductase [Phaeobacter sp. J2-8]MCJ7873336.1 SDR family oxidoreductase [Phaeobacter sp. J2-8]
MMLAGKTAFVTGASRGIGAAVAVGLAENGADVVISDLERQNSDLEKVRDRIAATGQKARVLHLDVTDKAAVEAAVAEAGQIDILVNNAGILIPSRLEDLDEKTWDAHFDVNAKGVLLVTNAVLPQMRARKAGRIINIASIAGRQGVPTQGHYAATKAVDITLTRVYAQEAGMDGITVNAICPGIILTEMGKENLGTQEAMDHWANVAALKRLGDPDDIVGPAVFFASDQSRFVTGQALNVCGGIYFH